MNLMKKTLPYLVILLLIPICLTSCTPPGEINVSCDVNDLINAMNVANSNSDTTKLILDPNCTYSLTNKNNLNGGQGPNGLPIVTTKIIIEGNNATLLRATSIAFRFFFIAGSGNLRIEDLTLENGYALVVADNPNTRGGAVYNNDGAFRAERSVFLENQAIHGEGGAIYNLGIMTLEDTTFKINSSNNGGAIYNSGITNIAAILQDVTFDTNIAHGNGGAIYNGSAEQGFNIIGSTFDYNHSFEHGGAIYTEVGDLDISNSEFLDNQAGVSSYPIGDGGAIYSQGGDITLNANNFYKQRALGSGGTIYVGPGGDLRLLESRIEDSGACRGGGGLYLEGEGEIQQSTFDDIFAGGTETYWGNTDPWTSLGCDNATGGAIYNSGTLAVDQSLIVNSRAYGDGDGIYNASDLTILNSTFHADPGYFNNEAINNHGSASLIFSTLRNTGLINSSTMTVKNIAIAKHSNGCVNSGNFIVLGENAAIDPACPFSMIFNHQWELGLDLTLSDNGGPTLTHYLRDDSPLIDMASCLSASGDPVLLDQRGISRPFPGSGGHVCDIGAYEKHDFSSPIPPPPLPPDDEPSECDPFAGLDISVIMLSINPETLVFPVYLHFQETVPFIGEDGTIPYRGKLGTLESYLCNQQGFIDRLYCMFTITPDMPGSAAELRLFKEGCEDPVFVQSKVTIPELPTEDEPPTCKEDLSKKDCKAAGGKMSTGATRTPYCICP